MGGERAGAETPARLGSADVELAGGLLRPGYHHSAARHRSRRYCLPAGESGFLGLRKLGPPSRKISEFSTRRSAMAVAMVVLKRILPQSEKGVFNAESIFMRTPRSVGAARCHLGAFSLRITGAAFKRASSLSVALKRPVRSFGAITDSRASSFTVGSARV